VPASFKARFDEALVVPLFHIFGSEELSMHAAGLAELAPWSYLALNPTDAGRVGLAEGDNADLHIGGERFRLPIKLDASLPAGVAGLPLGLEGAPAYPVTGWGKIAPAGMIEE
jgi:NADH-quinone oxidoreductase subunit G